MTTKHPNERIYLTLDSELITRVNIAYATAKRTKPELARSDFLQRLIGDALDQRDDVIGSRAALANRVGDKLTAKLDNMSVILLADFYLTAIRTIGPQGEETDMAVLRNKALLWAASNHRFFDERVAELRNKVASSYAKSSNEES